MSHTAHRSGNGLSRVGLRRSFALTALALGVACVSLPQPAGPVTLEGTVPPADDPAGAMATAVPGAVRGPLLLRGARLVAAEERWRWQVELVNPSDRRFEATVVVTLLDEDDTPLTHQARETEIAGHREQRLEGTLQPPSAPARFRVEYWVRVPPPPERRIDRIGD